MYNVFNHLLKFDKYLTLNSLVWNKYFREAVWLLINHLWKKRVLIDLTPIFLETELLFLGKIIFLWNPDNNSIRFITIVWYSGKVLLQIIPHFKELNTKVYYLLFISQSNRDWWWPCSMHSFKEPGFCLVLYHLQSQ